MKNKSRHQQTQGDIPSNFEGCLCRWCVIFWYDQGGHK